MRDREAAALTAAGLLLSVAVLRMLAPALPFDWMTLVLVALAAVVIVVPGMREPRGGAGRGAGGLGDTAVPGGTASPAAMEALRARMAQVDWKAGSGGLFDALRALHSDKPFSAMCAARGLLSMLAKEAAPAQEDMATLSLLMAAMDEMASAGEAAADSRAAEDLFAYALRALGRLEGR